MLERESRASLYLGGVTTLANQGSTEGTPLR